ncbi:MAG: hypothetical protein ACK5A0_15380 [Polaromonas sp.]|jgi:hypothetical protein
MRVEGMTEQDLALLNPAERAIMEDGDDDDLDALAELAGGDEDDDQPGNASGTKEQPAAKADALNDADDADDALVFTAKTPADAAEQRSSLETRKSDSFEKLMAGEIEPEEYRKVESEVSAAMEKLLQASITDAVTNELSQAQVNKQWKSEVATVVKTAAAEGFDYKANDKLAAEFDRLVKVYGTEAAESGMDDTGLKASKWALQEAHRTMKARHPDLVKVNPNAPADRGNARVKADLGRLPPSLKGAPVAASAVVGGEFAHMEGLTGADSERAFARLTKEQQERWLDT